MTKKDVGWTLYCYSKGEQFPLLRMKLKELDGMIFTTEESKEAGYDDEDGYVIVSAEKDGEKTFWRMQTTYDSTGESSTVDLAEMTQVFGTPKTVMVWNAKK